MALDYLNAKGWLTADEREMLKHLASQVPNNGTIMNIGVEYGASVVCLRAGNPTARIIAIDVDISKYEGPDTRAGFVTADSGDLVTRWPTPLDLVFVDGDHSDRGIKRDLKWADFVVPGGVIAFHDCLDFEGKGEVHPLVPDVNKRVMEWYRSVKDWQELPWASTMRVFKKDLA